MAEPGGESEASGAGAEPEPIEYDDDPYRDYFEADGFGLGAHRGEGATRDWEREDIAAKERVLGLTVDGEALAFPRSRVENAGGVVTATVGDEDVVVIADDGEMTAYRAPGTDWASTDADRDSLERLPAQWLFAFAWQDDHGDSFWQR